MKIAKRLHGGSILLATLLVAGCASRSTGGVAALDSAATATTDRHWTFESTPAWQDEFDYGGAPDATKWTYDLGGDGWGNHELQDYTDRIDNAHVGDGVLTIEAKKEARGRNGFSSARLVTKGRGDFLYGRFEIRAKLPPGRGTWPAIWMLPTDQTYGGWPKSGEIDIMEHVGFDPDNIHITAHTEAYYFRINTQKTATRIIDGATTQFHLYRVDWTPDAIRGYIDDALVLEFANEHRSYREWPFDQRFHLLLNIAVGGDWGGQKGVDDMAFPARMEVDYVRVYRLVAASPR
jgi:beta-glucanase (GH16 family)